MRRLHKFSAIWRKRDIEFLKNFKLSKIIEEGIDSFYVEEEEYHKIMAHYSQKDSLLGSTKPKEFNTLPATVIFDQEEQENANSYTLHLGSGKLDYYWDDANRWKGNLYNGICGQCSLPIGEQKHPWVLKRDFKQLDKYPFVSFEGLGGFVFCGKELADMIKRKFGIGHFEVLIGKQQRVSEYLVQLAIPLSPQKLVMQDNLYGTPFTAEGYHEGLGLAEPCTSCGQATYTNQKLDFFPAFDEEFDFDMVLTQEWFGWFRNIVVSRRFLDFCFEHKILKKWGFPGVITPQKQKA